MTDEEKLTTEQNVPSLSVGDLAVRAVALLKERKKTVATAESCTGGLVAAALTDIPGSSAVIGTGVVAYSWECKQRLLDVDAAVLEQYGAVSEPVARQMAQGVRRRSGADLGIAVTGEAGPVAGEEQPIGTVFIALADSRRTWVKELHLEGEGLDRNAIRRLAAAHLLELTVKYMEAYPAVMAGGVSHRVMAQQLVIPKANQVGGHAWLRLVLPHRGDSPRRLVMKITSWVLVVAVLVSCLWLGYQYLVAPDTNRDLQASLGELYREETSDLSDAETDDGGNYPKGMMTTFRSLYDRNADVVGWLRIAGTAVDYPVMSYADGLYENHSFDGQYSLYGQPHFDSHTTLDSFRAGTVALINGRNTGNGQMFSSLLNYRRLAFLKENAVIQLDTLYNSANYEIFAVMVADENRPDEWAYARYDFGSDEDFDEYIRSLQAHSLYRTDATITAEDSLLLLSTDARQEYGFSGARLVIAARRQIAEDGGVTAYHINSQVIMPQVLTPSSPRTTTATSTTTKKTTATTVNNATTATTFPLPGTTTVEPSVEASRPMETTDIPATSTAVSTTESLDNVTKTSFHAPVTTKRPSTSATRLTSTRRTTSHKTVTATTTMASTTDKTKRDPLTTVSAQSDRDTTASMTITTTDVTTSSSVAATVTSTTVVDAIPSTTDNVADATELTQVTSTATSSVGTTTVGDAWGGDATRDETNKTEIDNHANIGN